MPSHEIMAALPKWVIYIIFGVIVMGFILSQLAVASESIAKLLGPAGKWIHRRASARTVKDREQRLAEMREAFGTPEFTILQNRVNALWDMVNATMDSQFMNAEYIREDAEWHLHVGALAAEHGFKMPKHRTYTQFCREWRIAHGKTKDKTRGE